MTQTTIQDLPHSKESEMIVLGGMLNSPEHFKYVSQNLTASHFFHLEHKTLFQVLKELSNEKDRTDVYLACEELKSQDKLKQVGDVIYVTTLSQNAGTISHIDEYCEILESKKKEREFTLLLNNGLNDLKNKDKSFLNIIEETHESLNHLKNEGTTKIPLKSILNRLQAEDEFLQAHRGKSLIGLGVKTIKEFNEHMLGLRGLQLIAAAPNVGKTALTIQLALEVLETNQEACIVYVSLEMTEMEIFRRMILNLSGVNFKDLVLGTEKQQKIHENGIPSFINEDIAKDEAKARKILEGFGDRLQIIDQTSCPNIDARTVIKHAERTKRNTNSKRVMVIIDYLQVWPTRDMGRGSNELEMDKWRIGEMKKIRDAINNDPVLVISEARKPSQKEDEWGGDLSDVMGSARGTYTPDAVMLFSPIPPKAIKALWDKHELPEIKFQKNLDEEAQGKEMITLLSESGISLCRLRLAKCRDGMTRFATNLCFFFKKNQFKPIPWSDIKEKLKTTQRVKNG